MHIEVIEVVWISCLVTSCIYVRGSRDKSSTCSTHVEEVVLIKIVPLMKDLEC